MLDFLLVHLASEEKKHMRQSKFNCFVEVWWFSLKQKRKIKLWKLVPEAWKMAVSLVAVHFCCLTFWKSPVTPHPGFNVSNILDQCYFYEALNLTTVSPHFSVLQLLLFCCSECKYFCRESEGDTLCNRSLLVLTVRYHIWALYEYYHEGERTQDTNIVFGKKI